MEHNAWNGTDSTYYPKHCAVLHLFQKQFAERLHECPGEPPPSLFTRGKDFCISCQTIRIYFPRPCTGKQATVMKWI